VFLLLKIPYAFDELGVVDERVAVALVVGVKFVISSSSWPRESIFDLDYRS